MTHRGPFQPLLFCDSVILSEDDEGLPSKSAWPLPLANTIEYVCRTDDLRRILHREQIGYTSIQNFA